jgi:hypothetical protein
MHWFIWIESGECVLAPDHRSAVVMMQSLNSKCQVRSEDVLEEAEFNTLYSNTISPLY